MSAKFKNKEITTVAIIPARSGSKNIINKNIKKIKNKPLLVWAIETCKMSKKIDYFFVLTDSNSYKHLAEKNGAKVPFKRPKSISRDSSNDLEFVEYSIKKLAEIKIYPKIIVNIRPTTPFRDYKVIDRAINNFIKNYKHYSSLRSIEEMPETSFKTVILENKIAKPIIKKYTMDQINSPRQKFKKTYSPNGYIDIYKTENIVKNKNLYGKKSLAFLTKRTIEIDDLYDLELARKFA